MDVKLTSGWIFVSLALHDAHSRTRIIPIELHLIQEMSQVGNMQNRVLGGHACCTLARRIDIQYVLNTGRGRRHLSSAEITAQFTVQPAVHSCLHPIMGLISRFWSFLIYTAYG